MVSLRREDGEDGQYGVSLDANTPSAGRRRPVVVTAVSSGSTAALQGVLPGTSY